MRVASLPPPGIAHTWSSMKTLRTTMSVEHCFHKRIDRALVPLRPLRAVLMALLTTSILHGCASLATPCMAPVVVEMPAAWSGADSPPFIASGSLAQWWLRFNDPLLADLVTTGGFKF